MSRYDPEKFKQQRLARAQRMVQVRKGYTDLEQLLIALQADPAREIDVPCDDPPRKQKSLRAAFRLRRWPWGTRLGDGCVTVVKG